MKRIFAILTCAFLACTFSMNAQTKDGSDVFGGYWFVQAQGGAGLTTGETAWSKLISPAGALNFGYQFAPAWAVRAGVTGWQGKGAVSAYDKTNIYKYNYAQGTVDVLLDLCNLFGPYKVSRTLNPYVLAGVGVNYAFNNDEANDLPAASFPAGYRWDKNWITAAGRAGLGLDIRLSDPVHLSLEYQTNMLNDHFNSKRDEAHFLHSDWQNNLMIGLRINLGMKKARAKAAPAPVPVPVAAPAPAPAPAPKEVIKEVVKEVVPEFKPEVQNIFFLIDKWNLRESELLKIGEIIRVMKDYPESKITLTGYADKDTGTAQRNMFLSQKRAEAVAGKLVEAGISESRISVQYKGSEENPFPTPEENRVTVCVVK